MRKGNSENTDQGRPKLNATTMRDTPSIYQKSDNSLKHHQAKLSMAKSQSKNYLVKLKRTSSWKSLLRLCRMEGNGNQLLFFDFVPSLGAMIVSSCYFKTSQWCQRQLLGHPKLRKHAMIMKTCTVISSSRSRVRTSPT